MQLEAGKKYTDRRGRVYGPLVKTGLWFGEVEGQRCWFSSGVICGDGQRPIDLVAECVEPVQPESVKPVVDPGEGYRLLSDNEITLRTDEREYTVDFDNEWLALPEAHPRMVGATVAKVRDEWSHIVIRRKVEQPAPVESPDDLVIQDRVPARAGIDFGWNVELKDFATYAPCERWKWAIGEPYTGRMHGSSGNIGRLAVFCRRKDLPPVPPAEPEFPQYIIYATGGTFADCAYIVRTSEDDAYSVLANGKRGVDFKWVAYKASILKSGVWKRVTEKEAEKLVSRTRTVVLKEWLCWEDAEPETVTLHWCSTSPADETDQFSAWDNAVETGNTRTVEIPVT